jgi:hypothetical protein
MIGSRRFYEANVAKLSKTHTPEKFFSGGYWRDLKQWSWIEGKGPPVERKVMPNIEEQLR